MMTMDATMDTVAAAASVTEPIESPLKTIHRDWHRLTNKEKFKHDGAIEKTNSFLHHLIAQGECHMDSGHKKGSTKCKCLKELQENQDICLHSMAVYLVAFACKHHNEQSNTVIERTPLL